MSDEIGLHHWYLALNAEVGIALHITDPDFTLRALYRLKAEANDPILNSLKVVKQEAEVWIVHSRYFTGNMLDVNKIKPALQKAHS